MYESTIKTSTQTLKQTPIETNGEIPSSRFGHSFTILTPEISILFGGAKGNLKTYHFSNETYIFNFKNKKWTNIEYSNFNLTKEEIPSPRAAHGSCKNDNLQILIYSGSTDLNNKNDDLWLFDYNIYLKTLKNNFIYNNNFGKLWQKIPILGITPGKRYGHSLIFISPSIFLFGGNLSSNLLSNDVFLINLNNIPYSWIKINISNDSKIPSPRMYHSFCVYDNKMIIIGGRNEKNNALNDIWMLYKGNDKKYYWKLCNENNKNNNFNCLIGRYNHSNVLFGSLLILIGGRNKFYKENLDIEVFDFENENIFKFKGIGLYRQNTFIIENNIYIYSGFIIQNNIISSMNFFYVINLDDLFKNSNLYNKYKEILIKKNNNNFLFDRRVQTLNLPKNNFENKYILEKDNINKNQNIKKNIECKFHLSHDVIIGNTDNTILSENITHFISEDDELIYTNIIFRKLSINKLQEEKKRIGNDKINNQLLNQKKYNIKIIDKIINFLLRPFDWINLKNKLNDFSKEELILLIKESKNIIEKDKSLLKVRSPCKIFGNLFGQYNDLMRFFSSFGNPSDIILNGDIYIFNYIFLGNFIDLGFESLEIIFLLIALKVKFPKNIFLIRGNHEDINLNKYNGLIDECKEKLNDNINDNESIFILLNDLFNYLPFGIIIDQNILCIHSGIGNNIKLISDIENIKRPINIDLNNKESIVYQLLYSECQENENYNIKINNYENNNNNNNDNNKNICKFYSKNHLNEFMTENKIELIITSHKFINDGIKSFFNDKLIVVNSSTDFLDKYDNVGGMLYVAKKTIKKPIQIIPKLINVFKEEKGKKFRKYDNFSSNNIL